MAPPAIGESHNGTEDQQIWETAEVNCFKYILNTIMTENFSRYRARFGINKMGCTSSLRDLLALQMKLVICLTFTQVLLFLKETHI